MKRMLLIFSALVMGLTFGAQPASAHHVYPDDYWTNADPLIVRCHSNTTWSTAQINAIQGALTEIQSVANSNITFNFDDCANRYSWTNHCDGQYIPQILIEKVGDGYLGGNKAAETLKQTYFDCTLWNYSANKYWTTRIQIETPSDIYWGASVPEPSGDTGARGLLTHELVHAVGFNAHWDTDLGHPAWCDDTVLNGSQYRTMCAHPFSSNGIGEYEENRFYTLHADDITYLQAAY